MLIINEREKLGKLLKEYREKLGLSTSDIANRMGYTQGAILNYEKGNRAPTKNGSLKKLLKCLEVDDDKIEEIISEFTQSRVQDSDNIYKSKNIYTDKKDLSITLTDENSYPNKIEFTKINNKFSMLIDSKEELSFNKEDINELIKIRKALEYFDNTITSNLEVTSSYIKLGGIDICQINKIIDIFS